MLGFPPLEGDAEDSLSDDLRTVNALMRDYASLNYLIEAWVVFVVNDVKSNVLRWRLEAERRMRTDRGSGLSDAEVAEMFFRVMFIPD